MRPALILALIVGLPALSCKTNPEPDSAVKDLIGAEGGVVSADGASVTIPAGALESDVEIGVETYASAADAGVTAAPDFAEGVGAVVVLTPHGTEFETPVTVTLTFDAGVITDPDELVLLRLDDEADTTWEEVGPFTVSGNTVTFETSTFSVVSAAQVAAGACPCWNGKDLDYFNEAVRNAGNTPYVGQAWGWAVGSDPISWSPMIMLAMGRGYCKWQGEASDWSTYFRSAPTPPVSSGPTATAVPYAVSQYAACGALAKRSLTVDVVTNLGVTVSGLAAGDAITVSDGYDSVSLNGTRDLTWFPHLYAIGEGWDVTVSATPSGYECSVVNGTGTFSDNNELIEIECDRVTVNPACLDMEGDWTMDGTDSEGDAINQTGYFRPTTTYPPEWGTTAVGGTLYEMVEDPAQVGAGFFFLQYISDTEIEFLFPDSDHGPLWADPLDFSCDPTTGQKTLYARWDATVWWVEATFTSM